MPTRQEEADRKISHEHHSTDPTAASSSFNPAAAMPGVRAPAEMTDEQSPEHKRRRNLGDVDLDDDAGMDQADPEAAVHILMSIGMGAAEARKT
eukprot:7812249-Heterocapsa_arctica.AAC.1